MTIQSARGRSTEDLIVGAVAVAARSATSFRSDKIHDRWYAGLEARLFTALNIVYRLERFIGWQVLGMGQTSCSQKLV